MEPPNLRKLPVNISLGSNQLKIGYKVLQPDGSVLWIAPFEKLGLHITFHPAGLIKVSDNTGYSDYLRREDWHLTRDDLAYSIELLLDCLEGGIELKGDALAIIPQNNYQLNLMKRSMNSINFNVDNCINWFLENGPLWEIEKEYLEEYVYTRAPKNSFLFLPELNQFVYIYGNGYMLPLSLGNDYISSIFGLTRFFPKFKSLGNFVNNTINHLNGLIKDDEYNAQEYFKSQIDRDKVDKTMNDYRSSFENYGSSGNYIKKYSI